MSKQLTVEDFYTEIRQAAQTAAPLFKLYGWTYFDSEQPPTLNRLEKSVEELVGHAIEHFNQQVHEGEEFPEASVGSGRFIVNVKQYEYERELSIQLDLANKSQYKDWTW